MSTWLIHNYTALMETKLSHLTACNDLSCPYRVMFIISVPSQAFSTISGYWCTLVSFQKSPTCVLCLACWTLSTAVVVLSEPTMLTSTQSLTSKHSNIQSFPHRHFVPMLCHKSELSDRFYTAPSERRRGSHPTTLKRWKEEEWDFCYYQSWNLDRRNL